MLLCFAVGTVGTVGGILDPQALEWLSLNENAPWKRSYFILNLDIYPNDIGGAMNGARDGVFSYEMRSVLEAPESSKSHFLRFV